MYQVSLGVASTFFAVLALSLSSCIFYGFDLGVDFKGGRSYVVQFDKDITTSEVIKAVEAKIGGVPQVKTYGAANTVNITTAYMVDSRDEAADSLHKFTSIVDPKKQKQLKSLNIITGTGISYTRADGINVISLASLVLMDTENSNLVSLRSLLC
jgi:SecD/SecF fusion protein